MSAKEFPGGKGDVNQRSIQKKSAGVTSRTQNGEREGGTEIQRRRSWISGGRCVKAVNWGGGRGTAKSDREKKEKFSVRGVEKTGDGFRGWTVSSQTKKFFCTRAEELAKGGL